MLEKQVRSWEVTWLCFHKPATLIKPPSVKWSVGSSFWDIYFLCTTDSIVLSWCEQHWKRHWKFPRSYFSLTLNPTNKTYFLTDSPVRTCHFLGTMFKLRLWKVSQLDHVSLPEPPLVAPDHHPFAFQSWRTTLLSKIVRCSGSCSAFLHQTLVFLTV